MKNAGDRRGYSLTSPSLPSRSPGPSNPAFFLAGPLGSMYPQPLEGQGGRSPSLSTTVFTDGHPSLDEVSREAQRSQPERPQPQQPSVELNLSPEDVQTLIRLQDAGLISLDGLSEANHAPELTDWTHQEFLRHMVSVQKLRAKTSQGRDSTARCRVRYIQFLEDHDAAPVQLRPPEESSWLDHVEYRMSEEGATGTTMNQYRKALRSLLLFLGVDPWPSLETGFEEAPAHWSLPDRDTVRRFWLEPLMPDPYLAATYAHVFHFGFHMGVRPPSELVGLNVEDVDFANRRIYVRQPKKGGRVLERDNVPAYLLDAPNAKSLANYLEHYRPQVDTGSSKALFLNTNGDRFHVSAFGATLGRLGRKIWPKFCPYTMRRWFATEFLIANDFNVYATAQQLGDTVATVEKHYLDKAKVRAGMRGQYRMRWNRGGRS